MAETRAAAASRSWPAFPLPALISYGYLPQMIEKPESALPRSLGFYHPRSKPGATDRRSLLAEVFLDLACMLVHAPGDFFREVGADLAVVFAGTE